MKKVIYPVLAVLTFFAGAIWLDKAPQFASLVVFLSVAIGCILGYFYSKNYYNPLIDSLHTANDALAKDNSRINSAYKEALLKIESLTKINEPVIKTESKKSKKQSKQITQ